jgi:ketosteroid isomerase-like protein
MNKRALFSCFVVVAPLLTSSGCQANGDAQEGPAGVEDDVEAIKLQNARFSQAYVEKDLETQMSIYADDAVIGPPGRVFITGDGLSQYWAQAPGTAVVSHRLIPDSIVVHGDLAYDWGRYEGASGRVGAPSDFSGKYLVVWRRDTDGMWRMVQDMWNGGAPQ